MNIISFTQFVTEAKIDLFDNTKTGRSKTDKERNNPNSEIIYVTPDKGIALMAKAQGTNAKAGTKRRLSRVGAQEHIDEIAKDLKSGIKYNIPFIMHYAKGVTIQDGWHRLLAAKQIIGPKDKVPMLIIKR